MEDYIVYIRIDSAGRIIDVNSSDFVEPDWGIEIDRGTGDRYHHAQGNYFSGGIWTEDGIPRWKYANGAAVLRSDAEIEADRQEEQEQKSQAERIAELESALDALLRGDTE